jgi:hypothetical protein
MELINGGRPFRTIDAAAFGFTSKALRHRVKVGALRRLCRGVYVDALVDVDVRLRAAALGLVVPDRVAATLGTAAWLYGIPPLEPGAHLREHTFELASVAAGAAARRSACHGSSRVIPEECLVLVENVLATSPVTTVVDLARTRERQDALAYCDAFLRAGLVTRDRMVAEVERWAGRRGIEQAREMTGLADGRAESAGESWTRLRYYDAGFPPVEPQQWVCDDDGQPVYRLDLKVKGERKGVEYNGELWHGPDHEEADSHRLRWLEHRGWGVVAVGEREVLGRGHLFERVVGELLGCAPRLQTHEYRRRTRQALPWPSRGAVTA